MWGDSLMMFAVFPMRYSVENNDNKLLDYAAEQPQLYAKRLMDEETKLWHHSISRLLFIGSSSNTINLRYAFRKRYS